MKKFSIFILMLLSSTRFALAADSVSISGTVSQKGGSALSGVTVTLAKQKGLSTTTDAQGRFKLSGIQTGIHLNSPTVSPLQFLFRDNSVVFSSSQKMSGEVDIFSGNGRNYASVGFSNVQGENRNVMLPEFAAGLNIVRVTIGEKYYVCPLMRVGNEIYLRNEAHGIQSGRNFNLTKRSSAAVVDTLFTTKTGFNTKKTPIESYDIPSIAVTMDSSTGSKEATCTAALPTKKYADLTSNSKLPDPFLMADGTRMSKKGQWCQQRAYLSSLLQAYTNGEKPPKPDKVTATFSGSKLTISCTVGSTTKSFDVTISNVPSGNGPFPAVIGLGGAFQMTIPTGVAKISYPHNTIAAQSSSTHGSGLFYDLYGKNHSAGAMMAWAWGVSRVLDGLELCPEAKINPLRCGVTGCSRDGKGAMVCGVFDERIALTLPMEGGSGGISSWRIAKVENSNKIAHPDGCQTASQIVGENCWLSPNFNQFANGDINKLPTDAHTLAAICAPRAIFFVEGSQNSWNCNVCCWTAASAAQMVYDALGYKSNIGIVMTDHAHCGGYGTKETTAWNAFIKRFLLDDASATADYFTNDGSFNSLIDFTKWIDWKAPTLQ